MPSILCAKTMTKHDYFAHSGHGKPLDGWQLLKDHLEAVAKCAEKSAAKFGAGDFGHAAGLLHDIGKYSGEFQRKLGGENIRVDHSTAGAEVAAERFGPMGRLIAYVVAGHHAGLANGSGTGNPTPLTCRLSKEYIDRLPPLGNWQAEIAPLLPASLAPPPLKFHSVPQIGKERRGLCTALFVRMLFSALIDADRLDTEGFYLGSENRTSLRGGWEPDVLDRLKKRLNAYLADLASTKPATDVNAARAEILARARAMAAERPGLFSLTVPTGGGKTLSSLSFALEHAVTHELHRIIYVIPFTSIIEQTASVFRDAFGADLAHNVIEHHSAYRESGENEAAGTDPQDVAVRARLATENWDAPIVVTTAVQFFESLFSNRPGQCRKLHNIAKSVVILDEAQTLPLNLLRPCVEALDELARNYGTSVVICTATQPALLAKRKDGSDGFKGGFECVREIAPEPQRLYERLRRVTVKEPVKLTDDELAKRLRTLDHVLCIVGTRAHARELFQKLKDLPGTHHLSALMCPVHRSKKLQEIKAALKDGPCRLVATTVVEAGVDIDFPAVYRIMAGLDSIAQAAGRCNREGHRSAEESIIQLFEIEGRKPIPELRKFEETAREILRQPQFAGDPLSLAAIDAYFGFLYWRQQERLDWSENWPLPHNKGGFLSRMNEGVKVLDLPFADVDYAFSMIETGMEPVIVPYDGNARRLIEELRVTDRVRDTARHLQPYTVNVPRRTFMDLRQLGRIQPAHAHRFGEDRFVCLTAEGKDNLYYDDIGFDWSDLAFRKVESGIM